jgi:hypothetical protein
MPKVSLTMKDARGRRTPLGVFESDKAADEYIKAQWAEDCPGEIIREPVTTK